MAKAAVVALEYMIFARMWLFLASVCSFLSFTGVLAFISRYLLKSKPFFLKQSVPILLLYQQYEFLAQELTFVPAIHFVGKADKNLHLQKQAHLPGNRVLAEHLIREDMPSS